MRLGAVECRIVGDRNGIDIAKDCVVFANNKDGTDNSDRLPYPIVIAIQINA